VEKKELTPEEKLQKIIDQINENESDYISAKKIMDIIGIDPTFHKKHSILYIPSEIYKEFHETKEYKENYIS